jgi:hypothetical protein
VSTDLSKPSPLELLPQEKESMIRIKNKKCFMTPFFQQKRDTYKDEIR